MLLIAIPGRYRCRIFRRFEALLDGRDPVVWGRTRVSHGNPLDNIPRNAPAPAVIDLSSPGVGVAGQVLHVLKRHVLGEQVGDHQNPEAVGAEDRGQPCILEPPLEHEAHGVGRQWPVG